MHKVFTQHNSHTQFFLYRHKLWSHALAINGSSNLALSLKSSNRRTDVPRLFGAHVTKVSAYIQKLPNVTSDNISELDAHLAQAPMKLTNMGVDPETKQAILVLMPSFTRTLGHWAQRNNEAMYSLTYAAKLVDLVRSSFVVKYYLAQNLHF